DFHVTGVQTCALPIYDEQAAAGPERRSMSGARRVDRGRVATALALVCVVALGVGAWIAGSRVQSADQAAARAAPPVPSLVTAERSEERRVGEDGGPR